MTDLPMINRSNDNDDKSSLLSASSPLQSPPPPPATPMPPSSYAKIIEEEDDDDEDSDDTSNLMKPLVASSTNNVPASPPPPPAAAAASSSTPSVTAEAFSMIRSRLRSTPSSSSSSSKPNKRKHAKKKRKQRTKHSTNHHNDPNNNNNNPENNSRRKRIGMKYCCDNDYTREVVKSTLTVMHFLGRVLLWSSVFATAAGVVWYSRELKNNGTDPHLIAWFSAGAFVLLGFPISIYGIVMHLLNYYQPSVQCYVVRILWMVPLYSIESWLCLRFHKYAIYIETLRDCYESYVLYNFLQFLIEILGGEEELILMLKDKSPTRGVHLKPLNWCVRPWLMGQPVSRRTSYLPMIPMTKTTGGSGFYDDDLLVGREGGRTKISQQQQQQQQKEFRRPVKNVRWTSPFFVQCKFGVLQYVLLKFVSAIITFILEIYGVYKEGDFTPKGGYLYICIVTNLSQCWALYCLAFFYYATKNELGPIRPVGKFLSVKAVVFFTWWQSFMIAIVSQMGLIPSYMDKDGKTELSSEDVAKALQDYLICIEMFIGAIVHTFVFPHTDYLVPMGGLGGNGVGGGVRGNRGGGGGGGGGKRIGRKGRPWNAALMHQYYRVGDDRSASSKNSALTETTDVEMGSASGGGLARTSRRSSYDSSPTSSVGVQMPMPVSPMKTDADEGIIKGERGDDERKQANLLFFGEDTAGKDRTNLQEHEDESYHSSQASIIDSVDDNDDGRDDGEDEDDDSTVCSIPLTPEQKEKKIQQKTGFVKAFLDSTVPRDVVDGTVGIVKGDFNVQKKTLLHHAATSDEYDLFSKSSKRRRAAAKAAARLNARTTAGGAAGRNDAASLSRTKSPKELA